jgi:Protein-only RNase P/Pentacotripeptide-repeat region of PRORP
MDQDTTGNSGNKTQPDESSVDNIAAKAAAAPVKESSLKRPRPSTTNPTRGVVVVHGGDAMATTNQKKKKSNGTTTTSHPPKKRKHMDPIILQLRTDIHQCCSRNDLPTAWQLYNTARRNAVLIEAPVLSNLLSLCDGLGDRPLHIGTPRLSIATATTAVTAEATNEPNGEEEEEKMAHAEKPEDAVTESAATTEDVLGEPTNDIDDNEPTHNNTTTKAIEPVSDVVRCDYAQQIRHYMQNDRHLALTETAYTALTRLYARAGDLTAAEQCLSQAEQTQQCKVKLRLYSPVLLAYSARHNWMTALALWARVCRHQLRLTEREYASLLPAPYMERVLADLVEDVSVPSKQTVQILRQCLSLWCSDDDDDKNGRVDDDDQKQQPWRVPIMTDEMKDQLAQIPAPELQTTLTLPQAEHGWTESTNCTIDRSNGVLLSGCLQGVALQAVTLADEYVQTMLSMNERIVLTGRIATDATPFQGGGKGKKRTLNERDLQQRQSHWQRFRDYMAKTKATAATAVANQPMISVVIDGANVGYHEQNYKGCPKHVNYEQIDAVVRQFDPATILLVLHTRHCSRPLMPAFARRYLEKWQGFLYQTPHGMNDDWFWLHAALETNAMVVTNDHMRDHHFQMVTPRSFLRWRDRHQIYFHLAGGRGSRNTTTVQLTYPDPYSRRIQLVNGGLIVPMPKKGDESRFLDGCFVADDAPEEEMYVCFRPKKPGEV